MTPYFFVFQGDKATLYCETNSVLDGIVDGTVINGAWDFKLNMRTGVMEFDTPRGPRTIEECKVLQVPGDRFGYNYHDALPWAEEYWRKNRVLRWLDRKRFDWKEFCSRFARAKAAFVKAWNGPAPTGIEDFDDEIPF